MTPLGRGECRFCLCPGSVSEVVVSLQPFWARVELRSYPPPDTWGLAAAYWGIVASASLRV